MGMLEGKVAVITGGTSGIGASAARLFVAEGPTVVIAGRREDEGERLAAGLGLMAAEGQRRNSSAPMSRPRRTSRR